MKPRGGFLIAFEGGEGSGKTTQARHLYGLLCQRGHRARLLREPGGTPLGEVLRSLIAMPRQALAATWRHTLVPPQRDTQLAVKDLWLVMSAEAELFLFAACRAQLVAEVIRPSLARGITMICDRFIYSTVAYQGYGRGLDLELVRQVNAMAAGGIEPDLVVLLDLEPSVGLSRKRRAQEVSRFEEEELDFHRRVREGYLRQAAEEPQRWLVVDGRRGKAELGEIIWGRVEALLRQSQESEVS